VHIPVRRTSVSLQFSELDSCAGAFAARASTVWAPFTTPIPRLSEAALPDEFEKVATYRSFPGARPYERFASATFQRSRNSEARAGSTSPANSTYQQAGLGEARAVMRCWRQGRLLRSRVHSFSAVDYVELAVGRSSSCVPVENISEWRRRSRPPVGALRSGRREHQFARTTGFSPCCMCKPIYSR